MRPTQNHRHLMWMVLGGAMLGHSWLGVWQAQAQITPAGPEIQVTSPSPASAYHGAPAVAWEPAGDFVVAWPQQSAATGGWDVFAEQLGANGAALGPASQVSGPSSAFCRQSPAVAADAAGDFIVAWISNEQAGGTTGIYAQPFDSTGRAVGPQLHVNTTTAGNAQAPAVAMASDGRFLVTWQADGADGSSWGILARAYAANGTPLSGEVLVNLTTAGAQHSPAVAWLPASAAAPERYEAVWQAEGQDGAGAGISGIVGRGLDGAGNPLGGELAINAPATGAHAHPRLTSDPSGNFVVAWENLTAAAAWWWPGASTPPAWRSRTRRRWTPRRPAPSTIRWWRPTTSGSSWWSGTLWVKAGVARRSSASSQGLVKVGWA
jgi:hypothetical protein